MKRGLSSQTAASLLNPHLRVVMEEAQAEEPEQAVRLVARQLITSFRTTFDRDRPPFDMEALASFQGIKIGTEAPRHSKDAELVTDESGGVEIRLNRNRPRTRQRFSIGHEIGHTFSSEYVSERRRGRDAVMPGANDEIERLCDIAASELLLPVPWFEEDAATIQTARQLVALAAQYEASRDATIRRYVELHSDPCAAIYFDWNLKPTQERQLRVDRDQLFMYGLDPEAEAETARTLRVRYSVLSHSFAVQYGSHIPKHKSVKECGSIHQSARVHECTNGRECVDLGSFMGWCKTWSIPLHTTDEKFGPAGECAVVALLWPEAD